MHAYHSDDDIRTASAKFVREECHIDKCILYDEMNGTDSHLASMAGH